MDAKLDSVYAPLEDVVARLIEDELIIVPLGAGIGDREDELYTLNETGRAIWARLDGKATLRAVIHDLEADFDSAAGEVEKDVLGLVGELLKRNMLVEAKTG